MKPAFAALAFVLCLPNPSAAQDAEPTATPSVRWSLYSGTESLVRRGEDRKLIVFARAQVLASLPAGLQAFVRIEGSAIGAGAAAPELADPTTFSTLELYGGAYRQIAGPLSLAGLYGYTVPIEDGVAAAVAYPKTFGAGVMLGDPRAGRWLLLTYGKHDAAGAGGWTLFAGQLPIDGRISAVADGAIGGGAGGFVRFGVVVKVN